MKQLELLRAERLLRKKEIAQKLGLSTRTVDRKIADGLFPPGIKIGPSVRWRESVIDQWIAEGCPRIT
jgi:prophage regulatory protein